MTALIARISCALLVGALSSHALANAHLTSFTIEPSPPAKTLTSTLPSHTFDPIFENGLDCTSVVPLGTNLVSFFGTLPAGKKIVCLLAGTYTLTANLSLPSDTTLTGIGQGSNRAATTLFLASGVNDSVISIDSKQNVTIKHLKIDGNGAQQTGNPPPPDISVTQSGTVTINDVELANSARMGIAAVQNSYLSILHSYIHDMDRTNEPGAVGAAYISTSTSFVWVGDNYIVGNNNGPSGDGGIDCYDSDQVNIYTNTLVNTGESSIYTATPGCTHLSIWGNDIHNSNEWGIDITLGASTVFVGNNLIDGTGLGAMVFWQVNNVTVQYNTMRNGHAFPPTVPCKSIVLDTTTSVTIDGTNSVDSGPLSCNR